jgi:hypothetical protein
LNPEARSKHVGRSGMGGRGGRGGRGGSDKRKMDH